MRRARNGKAGSDDPHHGKKSYKFLWIFGAVVLVVGIGVLIYHFMIGQYHVNTKDAYVNGNLIRLAPQISGTVTQITTDQTQPVTRGQLLVRLDPHDTDVSLAQAKANLGQSVRDVAQLFAQEQRDEASVSAAEAQLTLANQNLTRDQGLIKAHGVSQENLERDQETHATPRRASGKPGPPSPPHEPPSPALNPKHTRGCCKPRQTCGRRGWQAIGRGCLRR